MSKVFLVTYSIIERVVREGKKRGGKKGRVYA